MTCCTPRRTELRSFRQQAQLVFQDPYGSLDPRMKVRRDRVRGHVAQWIDGRRAARTRGASCSISSSSRADAADRFPHEFSGGQRQRISIARALAVDPTFLIADEPVSALDVSVQSQILNLLRDLQERLGLTYLFIRHDMSVVRHVADRVAVMYLGKIVETGPAATIFDDPLHPYTQALLSSVPTLHPARFTKRIKSRRRRPDARSTRPPAAASRAAASASSSAAAEVPPLEGDRGAPRITASRASTTSRIASWRPMTAEAVQATTADGFTLRGELVRGGGTSGSCLVHDVGEDIDAWRPLRARPRRAGLERARPRPARARRLRRRDRGCRTRRARRRPGRDARAPRLGARHVCVVAAGPAPFWRSAPWSGRRPEPAFDSPDTLVLVSPGPLDGATRWTLRAQGLPTDLTGPPTRAGTTHALRRPRSDGRSASRSPRELEAPPSLGARA